MQLSISRNHYSCNCNPNLSEKVIAQVGVISRGDIGFSCIQADEHSDQGGEHERCAYKNAFTIGSGRDGCKWYHIHHMVGA